MPPGFPHIIVLSMWLGVSHGLAAAPKWVMLTNCQYIAHADNEGLAQLKGLRPNLPTGQKATVHLDKLQALEADARKRRVGLWAGSTEKKTETIPRPPY